jgi:hypothetical protein
MAAFEKVLSRNDTGQSGSHQAGILVPKGNKELISFFPPLNPSEKNPDVLIDCLDEEGRWWRFRYVYYNNKLHDPRGTRNEFRITRMTSYLRSIGAFEGQSLVFERMEDGDYKVSLRIEPKGALGVTRLSGWRQIH